MPPDGNHHCGAAAKTASPAATPASVQRCRLRRPAAARTSSAGSAHTQWCDQEIGEISSAAKAFSDSAHASAEPASARRMPRQASASTTADIASHVAIPGGECGFRPARASTAWMDWFPAYNGLPGLPVWKMTDVQNRTESCQASAKPAALTAAKEAAAVSAARRSPRHRKNSTNAAGVSFTAAATPTSAPRGQRTSGRRQSADTSAIKAMLTWP